MAALVEKAESAKSEVSPVSTDSEGAVKQEAPQVTVAIPSLNQGEYLGDALQSVFDQDTPLEVCVADGGSSDSSISIIEQSEHRLKYWRSKPDQGQAAAVNECIARGEAPFVCWLNSDDRLLPNGLSRLIEALRSRPEAPAVYGNVWNDCGGRLSAVRVEPFSETRLAMHCIISQPGTLIRRSTWEGVGGLREDLCMAMDYDLWWRLYRSYGPLEHVDAFVAVNRNHPDAKTNKYRRLHYQEAIGVLRLHYGRVPIKWWVVQPYAVWYRSVYNWLIHRKLKRPR